MKFCEAALFPGCDDGINSAVMQQVLSLAKPACSLHSQEITIRITEVFIMTLCEPETPKRRLLLCSLTQLVCLIFILQQKSC